MTKEKIIILGSSGFIGKALANFFSNPFFNVLNLTRDDIDLEKNNSQLKLGRYLTPQTILIIAAAVTRERGNNLLTFQSNLKIALNIASVLEKIKIKKCVFLSTADVYGLPKKLPVFEQTPINPQHYYALAKYLSEEILRLSAIRSKTTFLILRYNGIFGPGQKNVGYGPNFFINSLLKNNQVEIWGEGEDLRDYVYIKDLVKIISSLSLNTCAGIYNIATGKSITFNKIIKILEKISNQKIKIISKPRTTLLNHQKFSILKLRKVLPNFQFTNFELALKETYQILNNTSKNYEKSLN